MATRPHVVILGAGFAGIGAAQKLRDASVRLSIIDQHDYHTFQPLLYQVVTDELDPGEVGYPIRELLHRHKDWMFHESTVRGIDLARKQVIVGDMQPIDFDYLVIGLGAQVNFHGTPGAAEHSFPLYTMVDAIRLHDQILEMFEAVDKNPTLADDGALTFCIVGGGPTGTELAGAMSDLLHAELAEDYPDVPVDRVRIVLYETSPHLLASFQPRLRDYAEQALTDRGVEVHTGTGVEEVTATSITLTSGEVVRTRTLVWAAGLRPTPIIESLGVELGSTGRIPVDLTLQLEDHPGVFALGDVAAMKDAGTGEALPGLGSVALQAGHYVGKAITHLVEGKPLQPFHYIHKGTMAQIGRGAAVVELPTGGTLTGPIAWLAWLGIHLSLLSGAEEKTSVFVDWGWNVLTHRRDKRIILTDEETAAGPGAAMRGGARRP